MAKKYIINEQYREANNHVYDKMSQTIKTKVFNEKSIELLPAYFILAEANIGMGGAKLKKAEEFLIAANWNLLKSGQSGADDGRAGGEDTLVTREELERYHASLNITFGRLFMAQNRPNAHEKALEKLTRGIYMECQEHGPESVKLCKSYYYMGQLFQQSRQLVNAKAFFQKIIQIWKNFIIENDLMVMAEYSQQEIPLILYEEAEAHLRNIYNWYESELGSYDNACAECLFTQSLVAYKRGKIGEALDGMRRAL